MNVALVVHAGTAPNLSGNATTQELSLESCSSNLVPPQLPPSASRRLNRSELRFAVEPRLTK